jgi:hypothetical protein
MKKYLFSVSFLLVGLCLSAQITITQADLPVLGAQILIHSDTIVTQPVYDHFQTDTNFLWNPLPVTQHESVLYVVSDPTASPYSAVFPTSNYMLHIPGYGLYFMKSSPTELIVLGLVDSMSLSTPTVIPMQQPDTVMVFPLNYNTTYSSLSSFDVKAYYGQLMGTFLADSIRIKNISDATAIVDGWGTLVHPDGNLNVLRESKTILSKDSIWVRLQSFGMWVLATQNDSIKIEINYHANGFGLPVFTVRADGDSLVKEIDWIYNPVTSAEFTEGPLFAVFPNPSSDFVTLSTIRGEAETVEIFDLSGKLVYSASARKDLNIDVSSWMPGMYVIRWNKGNAKIAETKFIKN